MSSRPIKLIVCESLPVDKGCTCSAQKGLYAFMLNVNSDVTVIELVCQGCTSALQMCLSRLNVSAQFGVGYKGARACVGSAFSSRLRIYTEKRGSERCIAFPSWFVNGDDPAVRNSASCYSREKKRLCVLLNTG